MLLPRIAKIAVEQAAFHFDKLYSYTIPASLEPLERGCRVLVPFGGGNRKRQGIVVELDAQAEVSKLKPVCEVLDAVPLLDDEMMDLALWIKERTFSPLFDVVRTMLPTGLYMRVKPSYRAVVSPPLEAMEKLDRLENAVYRLVAENGDGLERDKLLRRLGLTDDCDLPDKLVCCGVLERADSASRLAGDATMRMVRLAGDEAPDEQTLSRCTDKQKSVLRLLMDVGSASLKELCYFCSVTATVVSALERKGLVSFYEAEVLRSAYTAAPSEPSAPAVLNEEQQRAFDSLLGRYREHVPAAALLYGVTGSGKTQVYMRLIDEVLADGRQALVLVPEISLTPQMMELFIRKYGGKVAVLHSALAIGERMDEWKRIRRGDARIVVGTRSAIFAPCSDLGLIVMDEEQEHTYKSESSPRYHARDVARFRCARHNALLLLTSATPSVESYHAALSGRYSLHTIASRFGDAGLPEVEVVDMRTEPSDGGIIGSRLRGEIQTCLGAGRQAILLLNRRGYNTFVSCRSCGHVVTCPSCSISLTYHRVNNQMICHYCGAMQDAVTVCPECGSDKIRYSGIGTQRAEREITELFPDASILRMDADTTMSRFAYEKKFKAFADGQYSIMIGTQMVAKGLDFPNVGLVGVLSADQSLYGDDYRCFETTFSLLTQVIGRAGRRDASGKAVIQTYTPDNHVIEFASRQDYVGFYNIEIAARRALKYPPYSDLCQFGFVGGEEAVVREAAHRFLRDLHTALTADYKGIPVIALDPVPAGVVKAAGKFRYRLLIKTVNSARLRKMVAELITSFSRRPENQKITVFADINPGAML